MKSLKRLVLVSVLLIVVSAVGLPSAVAGSHCMFLDFDGPMTRFQRDPLTLDAGEVAVFTLTIFPGTSVSSVLYKKGTADWVTLPLPTTLTVTGPYDERFALEGLEVPFTGTDEYLNFSITCGGGGGAASTSTTPAGISDGRLNGASLSTTSAVYDTGDYIDLYAINPANSQGVLVIHYSKANLPTPNPAENTVLEEATNPFTGKTITLYLLSSGELQINTTEADGKDYVFRW